MDTLLERLRRTQKRQEEAAKQTAQEIERLKLLLDTVEQRTKKATNKVT